MAVLPLWPPTKAPPPAFISRLCAGCQDLSILAALPALPALPAWAALRGCLACVPPPSQPAFAPPSAPPYSPHPIIKCQDLPLPSLFLTFHHLWQPSQRKQAEQSKAKHSPGALTGYPRASLASPAPWLAKTARKRGSTAKPWHPPLDLRFLASTPSTPRLHILGTPPPTTIPAPVSLPNSVGLSSPSFLIQPSAITSTPITTSTASNSPPHTRFGSLLILQSYHTPP